jgi:hypothetical protein
MGEVYRICHPHTKSIASVDAEIGNGTIGQSGAEWPDAARALPISMCEELSNEQDA